MALAAPAGTTAGFTTAESERQRPEQQLAVLLRELRATLVRERPSGWPALDGVLAAALPDPLPPVVALPLVVAMAAGGDAAAAVPIASASVAINLSLRLLDDIEDGDRPDAWWSRLGPARAHHVAWALRELSSHLVLGAEYAPELKLELLRDISQALMKAGRGQDHDLTQADGDLALAFQALSDRSGELLGTLCKTAARAAGASAAHAGVFERFGHHLGVGMQLVDDWESSLLETGARDLQAGKRSFPVRAALELGDAARRAELLALVSTREPWNVEAVSAVLDATGARAFTLWAAHQERGHALRALEGVTEDGVELLLRFCNAPFPPLPSQR